MITALQPLYEHDASVVARTHLKALINFSLMELFTLSTVMAVDVGASWTGSKPQVGHCDRSNHQKNKAM